VKLDDPSDLDRPWSRTLPAGVARELLLCGVFDSIILTYSRHEVVGLEHLVHLGAPVIFVANHSSHVDTPALLISLPARWRRRTAVAAAADYFYNKRLLADAVSLAFGAVPLERRGRGLDTDAIAHIGQLLDARWSLVVFAEGTRSRNGRVGRLRAGAAMLAAQHGVPIVPVHISGSRAAMPPGRRWMVRPEGRGRFARHTIRVSFGAPIRVAPGDDPLEAMERVRLFMAACGADTTPDPGPATRPSAVPGQAGQSASASASASGGDV
jgi:1-acyl-sn-glycerol-3-phosphate acyltransferase